MISRSFLLGHVADGGDEPRFAPQGETAEGNLAVEGGAVRAQMRPFEELRLSGQGVGKAYVLDHVGGPGTGLLGRRKVARGHGGQLVQRPAEQFAGPAVGVAHKAVADQEDGVVGRLEQRAVLALAFAQFLFGAQPFRHIARDARDIGHAADVVTLQGQFQPQVGPVRGLADQAALLTTRVGGGIGHVPGAGARAVLRGRAFRVAREARLPSGQFGKCHRQRTAGQGFPRQPGEAAGGAVGVQHHQGFGGQQQHTVARAFQQGAEQFQLLETLFQFRVVTLARGGLPEPDEFFPQVVRALRHTALPVRARRAGPGWWKGRGPPGPVAPVPPTGHG